MICQFIQESLFASNQYDAFHTLHQRNSQKYFSSALERANFLGTKFPGETFETQNMLVSRNGQSQFVSNSYSPGPTPFQKANQVEKHCYFENAAIEHSNYQDTHAKHVLPCNFPEIRHQ